MKITAKMTLQEAKDARDTELAEALQAYEARAKRVNEAFARRLRLAAKETSVKQVAIDLDMNRQNVHRILALGRVAA